MIDPIVDQATSLPERNGSVEAETNIPGKGNRGPISCNLPGDLAERTTVFMERTGNWFAGVQVKQIR